MADKQKPRSVPETHDLVERAQQGDNEATSVLIRSVTQKALFYTSKMLRSRPDAEDVAQEALLRICTNIGQLKDPSKFNMWFNSIVANETRQFMLKNYKNSTEDISEMHELEETDTSALPHINYENKELREIIMGAIDTLSEKQREAVLLFYYGGLTITEVSRVMGIKRQNASQYLNVALEKIKKKLDGNPAIEGAFAQGLIAFSIGDQIIRSLFEDAEISALENEAWVQQTAQAHTTAMSAEGAAAGAVGGLRSIVAPLLCIAAVAAVVIVISIIVQQNRPNYAPLDSAPPAGEQTPIPPDGEIVFTGGAGKEHVNPSGAVVHVSRELESIGWQIKERGSEDFLFSGSGEEIRDIFTQMSEKGFYGQYDAVFIFEDSVGEIYLIMREFTIQ